MIRPALLTTR